MNKSVLSQDKQVTQPISKCLTCLLVNQKSKPSPLTAWRSHPQRLTRSPHLTSPSAAVDRAPLGVAVSPAAFANGLAEEVGKLIDGKLVEYAKENKYTPAQTSQLRTITTAIKGAIRILGAPGHPGHAAAQEFINALFAKPTGEVEPTPEQRDAMGLLQAYEAGYRNAVDEGNLDNQAQIINAMSDQMRIVNPQLSAPQALQATLDRLGIKLDSTLFIQSSDGRMRLDEDGVRRFEIDIAVQQHRDAVELKNVESQEISINNAIRLLREQYPGITDAELIEKVNSLFSTSHTASQLDQQGNLRLPGGWLSIRVKEQDYDARQAEVYSYIQFRTLNIQEWASELQAKNQTLTAEQALALATELFDRRQQHGYIVTLLGATEATLDRLSTGSELADQLVGGTRAGFEQIPDLLNGIKSLAEIGLDGWGQIANVIVGEDVFDGATERNAKRAQIAQLLYENADQLPGKVVEYVEKQLALAQSLRNAGDEQGAAQVNAKLIGDIAGMVLKPTKPNNIGGASVNSQRINAAGRAPDLGHKPTNVSPLTGLNVSSTPGKLTGDMKDLTPVERAFAQELIAAGHNVTIIPTGTSRTADFLIDGQKIELKTVAHIQNISSNGISSAISTTIMNARGQSPNIVIDARNQNGMTLEIAQRAINRAYKADTESGAKIQNIIIITPQGILNVPRKT